MSLFTPDNEKEGRLFEKSLEEAEVMDWTGYQYFISPLTDGVIPITAELIDEVTNRILGKIEVMGVDKFITVEALGLPITSVLTYKTDIPFVVVRKRKYKLPGEVMFCQETGYHSNLMYINGIEKGDRVIIVDDILSTGGTLRGLIPALRDIGAEIVDIMLLVDKGDEREKLEKQFGININYLVRVEIVDKKVKVISESQIAEDE